MSEYQYYEFCSLTKPLAKEAREVMRSLSSRANISTHSASYVYNYSDFRGDPKQLLVKFFDVYFYINNWGIITFMFKYPVNEINTDEIKEYVKKHLISCEKIKDHIVVSITIENEDDLGWVEGEELLPDLLPLYDELKARDYRLLKLVTAINKMFDDNKDSELISVIKKIQPLSATQEVLLNILGEKI